MNILFPLLLLLSTLTTSHARLCNGLSNLCNIPVNDILYAMVHNAMASVEGGYLIAANHMDDPIVDSLDVGYRALSLDLCRCGGEFVFCHGGRGVGCTVGTLNARNTLELVNKWIDDNPNNVVMIYLEINEDAGADFTLQEIYDLVHDVPGGFGDRLYQRDLDPAGAPWPTLGELIDAEQQVLFFYQSGPNGDGDHPHGINYWFYHGYETSYEWDSAGDFESAMLSNCEITRGRGRSTGDFFLLNAFVTKGGFFGSFRPSRDDAQEINTVDFCTPVIDACEAIHGFGVNVISVDFWSEGNLPELVLQYNAALEGPPTPAPTQGTHSPTELPTTSAPTPTPTQRTHTPTVSPTTSAPTGRLTQPPTVSPTTSAPTTPPTQPTHPLTQPPITSAPSTKTSPGSTAPPTDVLTMVPTIRATGSSTMTPTLSPTPNETVCTLEVELGTFVTFAHGESLGDYITTACGSAYEFPCFCNTNLLTQVECPYCGFPTNDNGDVVCARDNETIVFEAQGVYRTCSCEIPADPWKNPVSICEDGPPGTTPNSTSSPSSSPSVESSHNRTTDDWVIPQSNEGDSAISSRGIGWVAGGLGTMFVFVCNVL